MRSIQHRDISDPIDGIIRAHFPGHPASEHGAALYAMRGDLCDLAGRLVERAIQQGYDQAKAEGETR